MNEVITIENTEMQIREYNGQRVVTFKDIDTVHQRTDGTAKRNFLHNKKYFVEGEDYVIAQRNSQKDEIRTFGFSIPTRGITLITESGYLMLVKSFNDDLSWKVQRRLVNSYFNAREQQVTCEEVEKESDADIDLIEEKPQVPLIKGWHNRNKGRLARIQRRTGFTLTRIYHCILKNVGEKYNLKEANNMYKKCTGKEPEYAMDIIEYFPELAEAADRYLDGVERALSTRR
jgi:hypothetical protein|nr:MAG TPA: hypothetical protein [Caudoviricetes sp.]